MAPSFLGKLGPSGKHGLSSESGPDGISWGTCPILPAAGEHWPYSACSARSRCTAGEAQHTWNGGRVGLAPPGGRPRHGTNTHPRQLPRVPLRSLPAVLLPLSRPKIWASAGSSSSYLGRALGCPDLLFPHQWNGIMWLLTWQRETLGAVD